MAELVRPSPVRWAWYALGGRLPARHRAWVRHDVTARSWRWRHAARATVLLAPLCLGWLLLPGPLGLRLALVLLAATVGYFYSLAYAEESAEHRVAKHGYPHGEARRVRAEATAERDREQRERYAALYRDGG